MLNKQLVPVDQDFPHASWKHQLPVPHWSLEVQSRDIHVDWPLQVLVPCIWLVSYVDSNSLNLTPLKVVAQKVRDGW